MADLRDQLDTIRGQYPAFARRVNGAPAAFFDGPGGTQTPQRVIDAVSDYLCRCNANHEGLFATSQESDVLLNEAHAAYADFVGADDPQTVVFGPNMTTITFSISRSLARNWKAGDEVLLTTLDHDANYSPWKLAAEDAGATVRVANIRTDDCTLDLEDLRSKLSEKTRLVAIGFASNSVGTLNPIREITKWAREMGALVYVDAVHWAPHGRLNVAELDCDFLACSVYKFFGPHVGVLWGRRELLADLTAYKVRPASNALPGKWMTGTQNHEGIAGALEAVNYLADIGRAAAGQDDLARPAALDAAFSSISAYEQSLAAQFMNGIAERPQYRLWGIRDVERMSERAPTFAITHNEKSAAEIAAELGRRGLFVWHGHYYALNLSERLGREPDGMVRIGLIHYNTSEEVERLLTALDEIA